MLVQRWDTLALQMIADGASPDDGAFDEILQRQQTLDRAWRARDARAGARRTDRLVDDGRRLVVSSVTT